MIGVHDVATRVFDLLSAQRLDWAPRAVGCVQDRGDSGAAPPGERRESGTKCGRQTTDSAELGVAVGRTGPSTAKSSTLRGNQLHLPGNTFPLVSPASHTLSRSPRDVGVVDREAGRAEAVHGRGEQPGVVGSAV